jgi:hypothetical protein
MLQVLIDFQLKVFYYNNKKKRKGNFIREEEAEVKVADLVFAALKRFAVVCCEAYKLK